jgi:hypothetical protein
VKTALKKVAKAAHHLSSALRAIDVGTQASKEYAGRLLEYEMGTSRFEERLILIPDCVQLLNWLSKSASEAAQRPKPRRGPKGAGGNLAFDWFIESLHMAAWQRGGRWTNYRSADGTWAGSLPKALKILKPYLPRGFFPAGDFARSAEHIRKKLADHITKNRTSSD